jgi:isoquinoline 1-oxidoreductase beta subunit
MGVAIVEDHGSICAACATVRVSRGELAVEKVVIVIDSGHIINPHNAAEQLEGSVCWELTHAWLGGLELREGRFVNTNFDSYPLLRMSQMPEVEVHFALSGGKKWGGIGEPAGPPVPPAVANAIYFATRKRIRSTPFKNHDLSWSCRPPSAATVSFAPGSKIRSRSASGAAGPGGASASRSVGTPC